MPQPRFINWIDRFAACRLSTQDCSADPVRMSSVNIKGVAITGVPGARICAITALLEAGVPVLSIPAFFTPDQRRHAVQSCGAQAVFAPCRDGRDLHQVFDILPLIGLHPDMLAGPRDQPAEAVDVGGLFRHAMHERVGDEAHLVQRVGHGGDLVHRRQVHVAIFGVARVHIAMPAGAGAHDEGPVAGLGEQEFACRLVESGSSLKEVADVLRHRSLNTTLIYAKLDTPQLSAVPLPGLAPAARKRLWASGCRIATP